MTFTFGHLVITGRPLGFVGNVLGAGLRSTALKGRQGCGENPDRPGASLTLETVPSGSLSAAPSRGRPCPKVFYPHLLEQLVPGGRQMVLDPPSVAV